MTEIATIDHVLAKLPIKSHIGDILYLLACNSENGVGKQCYLEVSLTKYIRDILNYDLTAHLNIIKFSNGSICYDGVRFYGKPSELVRFKLKYL